MLLSCGGANVDTPTLLSISVTPASPSVGVSSPLQLTATGTYSDGLTRDITALVGWSSDNTTLATVNSAGRVSNVASVVNLVAPWTNNVAGTPNITATIGTFSVTKAITVTYSGLVVTLAGTGAPGALNGNGTAASFNQPNGVAVDAAGNVYVADTVNNLIRKIASGALATTTTLAVPSLSSPRGVAVDAAGNIYVADTSNNKILKITSAGVVTTLAGSGTAGALNGTGTAASFISPNGVAVDAAGNNIYVADTSNYLIRRITSAGLVTTLAGTAGTWGNLNGTGTAATFNTPKGVAVDAAGDVYEADDNNHKIRKITSGGVVTTLAGTNLPGVANGTGTVASFNKPSGVAVDAVGNVYVGDTFNSWIRKITPDGVVTTLVGSGLSNPTGVAVDAKGNVYVADTSNHKIKIVIY